MVKKGKTKKLFYLSAIGLIILLTGFLLVSGLNFNNPKKIISQEPYRECLNPEVISQNKYLLGIYDSNLLYTNLININGTLYPEPDKLFIWNIGPDHKPNTADDLNPVEINATGILIGTEGVSGEVYHYGEISPKIDNRYIVWASTNGRITYSIEYIDMGTDGILNNLEASNIRTIYPLPYLEMKINSVSLKEGKVSFTYNTKATSINSLSPKISFCDLNLNYGQSGACFQNSVITFDSGAYDSFKMTGNAYFYNDPYLGTQVLFGEITFPSPAGTSGSTTYSIFSWNQNSGINLIANETELIDVYQSLVILSYQDAAYGYFHPGIVSANLIPISTGAVRNTQVNARNRFSSLGNYLAVYSKDNLNRSRVYLGSLGNGLELRTPFAISEKTFLDSSSSGNHLYNYQNDTIYYTQCFGI